MSVRELSTSTVGNLWPGQVMPDGRGGILATWVNTPNNQSTTHPYQAAFVSAGGGVTTFDMPMAPEIAPNDSHTQLPLPLPLVLGQNGNAFVSYGTSITSFIASSGSVNWSIQNSAALVAATNDGGIAINDPVQGVFTLDAGGAATQVTGGSTASSLGYSWTQQWVGLTDAGSQMSGLALPITMDAGNPWPTTGGSASRQFAAMAICPCLTQSDDETAAYLDLQRGPREQRARAGDAGTPGTPWWKPAFKAKQAAMQRWPAAVARPAQTSFKLASFVPRSFGSWMTRRGTDLYAPLAFQTGTQKQVVLVGDGGFPGGGHNVGRLFDLAADTFIAGLNASGSSTVVRKRVSSVQDFNAGLTANGPIDGGVTYFGHAATMRRPDDLSQYMMLLAPGAASGVDTNVSVLNVNTLSNANLGPNMAITLRACNAGARSQTNGPSIAQLIANRLNRPVIAWKTGLFFTNDLSRRAPRDGEKAPGVAPIYLIPLGGVNVRPCTFNPNQPEPQNCGGGQ